VPDREHDNPIRYIEELARFSIRPRRRVLPGCEQVYRGRGGRMFRPRGGLTSGELWLWNPRLVYDIDIEPHETTFLLPIAYDDGRQEADVQIYARWRALDPLAVVEHRITDIQPVARRGLSQLWRETTVNTAWPTNRALQVALIDATPETVDLPGGVRLDRIEIDVRPFIVENPIRSAAAMLLGDQDGTMATEDVLAREHELAQAAIDTLSTPGRARLKALAPVRSAASGHLRLLERIRAALTDGSD
jgi:hypothetical protein